MSKFPSIATAVLFCFTTAIASIIGNDAAMSDPVLIDPSSQYYERSRTIGYAYDFCLNQSTLGYIVVSETANKRLQRWYSIDEKCFAQSVVESQSSSPSPLTPVTTAYSSTSSRSSGRCVYSTDRDARGNLCGGRASTRRRGGR